MPTPRIEVDLTKIKDNAQALAELYHSKNISICAVTKVICGNLSIARTLTEAGITMLADSKIANLKRFRSGQIDAELLLIGTPLLSQASEIVIYADISHNSNW